MYASGFFFHRFLLISASLGNNIDSMKYKIPFLSDDSSETARSTTPKYKQTKYVIPSYMHGNSDKDNHLDSLNDSNEDFDEPEDDNSIEEYDENVGSNNEATTKSSNWLNGWMFSDTESSSHKPTSEESGKYFFLNL